MRLSNFYLFLLACGMATYSFAERPSLLGRSAEERRPVVINNRILAKVHGKAISVIDVQKKMDVVFYRRFPEFANSPTTRHQFYSINWRPVLNDLIDKELILFDAKLNKIEVSRGDVRQELEEMFGPNIVANLDKVGIDYDEARSMIEGDLLIRRMMSMKVHLKAHGRITPRELRKAYEEYSVKNKRSPAWAYRVITVRHADAAKEQAAAEALHAALAEKKATLEELSCTYQTLAGVDPETKVTFSEEFHHKEEEASEAYRAVLRELSIDSYSSPLAQQSRGKSLHRIFYLKEMTAGGMVPFPEVEGELRQMLMGKAIAEETDLYISKLRKEAGLSKEKLDQFIPENFQPFSLQ